MAEFVSRIGAVASYVLPDRAEKLQSVHALARGLQERGLVVGVMLYEFDTPRVMRILSAAGADFAIFDLEHTGWDPGSLRHVLAAGRGTGVCPIVRVNRVDPSLVSSALDAGAMGVMAPMIESEEQARLLVNSARYPPVGRRGFGVLFRDELEGGPAAAVERANRETIVIAQIETREGIENADAIAAVPGVDFLWLGQFDLTLSLGMPGDFAHPAYDAAVERLLAACQRVGKPLGQMISSTNEGLEQRRRGFQLLAYADVWLFEHALQERLEVLRESV